jgi:hypothetical protein
MKTNYVRKQRGNIIGNISNRKQSKPYSSITSPNSWNRIR